MPSASPGGVAGGTGAVVGGPSRAADGSTPRSAQAGVVAVYRALAVHGDARDVRDTVRERLGMEQNVDKNETT